MNKFYFAILLFCLLYESGYCLDNGLALTPPMGWMTWHRFKCITNCTHNPNDCISESLIKQTAELMVSEGYLKAGYEYIIMDDCWLASKRDTAGRLQPDPERFPSGIKALADHVHNLGLKFGIYEDSGTHTCAGYPGMMGHLETDAATFADWGIDYIKVDGCHTRRGSMVDGYVEFGRLLNATGRPIVYSCSWPAYQERIGIEVDYEIAKKTCNLWRNWYDVEDYYPGLLKIINWYINNQDKIAKHSGPGHWNDPDMLLIGNYGLSYDQSVSQMVLWSMLAAPLLMSVDLRTMKEEYKDILLNPGAIKINQDPLGIQGTYEGEISNIDVWTKPISPILIGHFSYAIAFVSRRTDGVPYHLSINLKQLDLQLLPSPKGYFIENIFDFSEPTKRISLEQNLDIIINPTGSVLLRLTPALTDNYDYQKLLHQNKEEL